LNVKSSRSTNARMNALRSSTDTFGTNGGNNVPSDAMMNTFMKQTEPTIEI